MKLKISSIFLLVAVVSLSAFKSPVKPVAYTVDPAKSTITWIGKKVTGSHNGTIALQSGTLNVDGKKVTGGTFTIDMNSIKDADGSAKLEGHLKADDFFGTAKFPTSTFVITKVAGSGAALTVTGNLTIKGITKPVSFPATVAVNADGTVSALAGKILVDRTKYDIRYGSKSFFDSIGDKAIDDNFEIGVKLVAKK
ncbi:polyisoprenoid-binding protein YceI [Pedobacter psychrotolerans]|uniref:Lipid-binding protein n=1 Tax=Pedobacter psychrotolerans TaxID=1843235 RepID=A0A4R2HA67_9SPHI|nr:YceI family protein [Pedobacter psychrotolerans]TCO23585.1 polyisoprenoid-binding protein YceI [Pedobacter psychrotolerans]GGE60934.1 lipid-binding protein [Pedobacter psychrotolerans]